jgi:hypothetical protein
MTSPKHEINTGIFHVISIENQMSELDTLDEGNLAIDKVLNLEDKPKEISSQRIENCALPEAQESLNCHFYNLFCV